MKKRKLAQRVLAALIVLAMMIPSVSATAADQGSFDPFITTVRLDIYTAGGTFIASLDKDHLSTGANSVPKDAQFELFFDFTLPDDSAGTTYQSGDTFTVTLPAVFDLSALNGTTQQVMDGTEEFGVLTFTGSNTATLTLSDYVDGRETRGGSFWFRAKLAPGTGEDGAPQDVVFKLQSGGELKFTLDFEEPAAAGVTKDGSYSAAANKVNWSVTASSGGIARTGAYIVDTIGPNQTLEADTLKLNGTTPIPLQNAPGDATPNYTLSGSTLTVYVGDLAKNASKTVTYQTTPLIEEGNLTNNVKLYSADSVKLGEADKTVPVTATWITKQNGTVTEKDPSNRPTKISWTVVVNPESRTIADPTLTDTIPKYLTLDAGSVTLTPQGGSAIPLVKDAGTNGYTLASGANGTSIFTYAFGAPVTVPYTLAYTTSVDPAYYNTNQGGSFVNTATLTSTTIKTGSASATGSVGSGSGVGSNILAKSAVANSFNFNDYEISWTVTVNGDHRAIKNAVVTDKIPAGQDFVPGSFQIQAEGGSPESVTENQPNGVLTHVSNAEPAIDTLAYSF